MMKLLVLPVMSAELFSIRMRAERDGGHCCGAERIAPVGALPALAAELVARALEGGALPEAVHCSIERISGDIPVFRLPEVRTREVTDWQEGRRCARDNPASVPSLISTPPTSTAKSPAK